MLDVVQDLNLGNFKKMTNAFFKIRSRSFTEKMEMISHKDKGVDREGELFVTKFELF
jgi:hypothetical protein